MDELTTAGVLLALFALVILVGSRAWRRAYLEQLPALEGERTLFEERGITVDTVPQVGRGTRFPNSLLRLTDRRLVVAQQVLFRPHSHYLRYVVVLDDTPAAAEALGTRGALAHGYVTFRARRADLALVRNRRGPHMAIRGDRAEGLAVPAEVRVFTRRPDELATLLA